VAYLRLLSLLVVANVIGALALAMPVAADTDLPIGGQAQVYYTDGEGVRIRERASVHSDTLKVLEEGWRVTVLQGPVTGEDGAAWFNVSHVGTTGYIKADYLTTATGETGGLMPGEPAKIWTDDGTTLRLRERVEGEVLLTMPHGGTAMVLDGPALDSQNRRWYNITYEGTAGWALGAYLRPTEYVVAQRDATSRAGSRPAPAPTPAPPPAPAPPAEPKRTAGGGAALAALAREYLGYPYVFGGSTPAGFDCSGFVKYVAARALGIQLGRDVFAQINAGVPVAPDDLRPGDLVFQKNTYRWGLSHVGIYIGNGQMISAQSESTGVRIQHIWDGYWGPRFYGARRIA
jgi:cell wall-associated NlpC family hydrolase